MVSIDNLPAFVEHLAMRMKLLENRLEEIELLVHKLRDGLVSGGSAPATDPSDPPISLDEEWNDTTGKMRPKLEAEAMASASGYQGAVPQASPSAIGAPAVRRCPRCGAPNDPQAGFCIMCGTRFQGSAR